MDYTGILGSATRLKRDSLYKVTINDATKELLVQIDASIIKAHDAGMSRIDFRLPINFRQIDNSVTNAEIQTAVYFNIITELEKKEYDVHLQFHKTFTKLEVSWSVRAEMSELKSMQDKIRSLAR